jgi:hypothetical protein
MSDVPLVQELSCETSVEFVNSISLQGPHFYRYHPHAHWIFRGHAKDSYVLLPAALRPESRPRMLQLYRRVGREPKDMRLLGGQIYVESTLLQDFLEMADKQGLPLPGDVSGLVQSLFMTRHTIDGHSAPEQDGAFAIGWPARNLIPLIALAQHYGVPTRLLDWTYSPYVAAYFAALEAAQQSDSDVCLSVWALDVNHCAQLRLASLPNGDEIPIVVSAPHASNPNLHAQSGIFSLQGVGSMRDGEATMNTPIDQIIRQIRFRVFPTPVMFHFSVPASEAKKILWLLAKEGITKARLFPGYRGIVQGIEEEALWQYPYPPGSL